MVAVLEPLPGDVLPRDVVEPINSRVLLDGVSSEDTTEVVLDDSYHVATLDNDAPLIFAGSVDWIRARTPADESSAAEFR